MNILTANKENVAYDPATDTLFVRFGSYGEACTEIVDVDPSISVLYGWPDGGFAGVEVFDFKKHYGSLPAKIRIEVDDPFLIEVPSV
jgi:uncharacterized protein YuzE